MEDINVGVPQPGDVFREYFYRYSAWPNPGWPLHVDELDPHADGQVGQELRRLIRVERPLYLTIHDLQDAVRAELIVEYWGGHSGTSYPGFRVNGSAYLPMPVPVGTPTPVEAYYKCFLGSPAAPIPLDLLHEGVNEFRFAAGPQVAYDFGAGFYWLYSFGVRVYYDPARKLHPQGTITTPASGQLLGDYAALRAEVTPASYPVAQVDYIGCYWGFDWAGNGRHRDWHLLYRHGVLSHHLGTSWFFPWQVTWDSTWVPDQDEPFRIAARISDVAGLCSMTPAVEGLRLLREDREVRMYPATEVPENFGVRMGARRSCKFIVRGPLGDAHSARLVVSTWAGSHEPELFINGHTLAGFIGRFHDVSLESLAVPLEFIREGENVFTITSPTEEHAVEVNWPGPVLLVQYNKRMVGLPRVGQGRLAAIPTSEPRCT